jgi:lipoprotein signal peptidase
MDFNTGDILIFREKKLMHALYSMISLDLDNHIGVIVKFDDKIYLNHLVITSFKNLLLNTFFNYNYNCGKVVLTPVKYLKNKEYYHYKVIENIEINEENVKKAIKKAETLNYLSNLPALINFLLGRKYFNVGIKDKGHTCLSYTEWYLSEISLYDIKYLDDDYYKKYQSFLIKEDNNHIINGLKVNYKLIGANNVGKKDLSKFNPYKWAVLFSFMLTAMRVFFVEIKNENNEILSIYKLICLLLSFWTFAMIGNYHTAKMAGTSGRRFIGNIIAIIFVNILVGECIFKVKSNHILYYINNFSTPIVFSIRMASWLSNDIIGNINKKTLRPYDTSLYEAYFTGFFPLLFMICASNYITKKNQNLVIAMLYSGSRFYIEFYKKSYIKNSILTLGQIDTITYFIIIYWYITCNVSIPSKLFQYSLLNILFYDINNRISLKEYNYTTYITENIQLIWKKTYNKGFYNGKFKEKGKIFKLIYPLTTLFIYNLFFINNSNFFYIFNCFALLNILERFINGHVTDYLTIKFYKFRSYNLNYADIIMNVLLLLTLFSNIYIYFISILS